MFYRGCHLCCCFPQIRESSRHMRLHELKVREAVVMDMPVSYRAKIASLSAVPDENHFAIRLQNNSCYCVLVTSKVGGYLPVCAK